MLFWGTLPHFYRWWQKTTQTTQTRDHCKILHNNTVRRVEAHAYRLGSLSQRGSYPNAYHSQIGSVTQSIPLYRQSLATVTTVAVGNCWYPEPKVKMDNVNTTAALLQISDGCCNHSRSIIHYGKIQLGLLHTSDTQLVFWLRSWAAPNLIRSNYY